MHERPGRNPGCIHLEKVVVAAVSEGDGVGGGSVETNIVVHAQTVICDDDVAGIGDDHAHGDVARPRRERQRVAVHVQIDDACRWRLLGEIQDIAPRHAVGDERVAVKHKGIAPDSQALVRVRHSDECALAVGSRAGEVDLVLRHGEGVSRESGGVGDQGAAVGHVDLAARRAAAAERRHLHRRAGRDVDRSRVRADVRVEEDVPVACDHDVVDDISRHVGERGAGVRECLRD